MPRFSVNVPRDQDYADAKMAAGRWASRLGVRPRGKGVLSAWVRHLLQRGVERERKLHQKGARDAE